MAVIETSSQVQSLKSVLAKIVEHYAKEGKVYLVGHRQGKAVADVVKNRRGIALYRYGGKVRAIMDSDEFKKASVMFGGPALIVPYRRVGLVSSLSLKYLKKIKAPYSWGAVSWDATEVFDERPELWKMVKVYGADE